MTPPRETTSAWPQLQHQPSPAADFVLAHSNRAQGKESGGSQTEIHVAAAGTLTLQSGRDIHLSAAPASGERIAADVAAS